jgi:hypothetical protein
MAWAKLQNLPIQRLFAVVQRQRAWEIGIDLDLATVYDTIYLTI